MTWRPVRGARYLDAHNQALAGLVTDVLPYLDMDGALRAYRRLAMAGLRDKDIAFLNCNDRFFLLSITMRRKDARHPWLYDRCREVEEYPDGYLDLWSREHYKSTIITFAGILQEILADPELTVAIFSHTKHTAEKFLIQIKEELERNEIIGAAHADVLWERPLKEAPTWTKQSITLKRKTNPKEATVEAWGLIDGMPTGGHYALLVYDDVITRREVNNSEMVRKATESWELSDNLGAGEVRKWHIGTRYHFGDTYGQIMERQAAIPRIYPATHDGTLTGKPVFRSEKWWQGKLRAQRTTISAQMLQNPLAGSEQIFRPEWFRVWQVRPSLLNIYIMVDPSLGRTAKSDRTAMMVVGVDRNLNKFLLGGYCHRMPLSERWRLIKTERKRWLGMRGTASVRVGYERYGQQTDQEYFSEKMRDEGESFDIQELAWPREGGHSKADRIQRLEPDFRLGKWYFPALMWSPGAFGEGVPQRVDSGFDCYWHMDSTKNQIVSIPSRGPTRAMKRQLDAGRPDLAARALKRLDFDRKAYDLTRLLIDEILFFPFAPHDDGADALSRLYDMEITAPAGGEQIMADEINSDEFEDA